MLSLVALGIVSFAAIQRNVDKTEDNVAKAFGVSVSLYSNAVAAYIADEGTSVPAGTFTGFDWLKGPGCGGSATKDYLPCDWQPRLPFNIALETEVIYATATPGDPCPDPVGHVCAETRLSVPSVNGQERLDLVAEMLHATQGATSAVRGTQQDFRMNDLGQVQVSTRGSRAPPSEYLRRDGVNNWAGPDPMNLGDHDFVAVDDIQASGELVGGRFIDRDDPAFIVDPDSGTTLNQFRGAGDFDATGGGTLLGHAEFGAVADVESAATFNALAEFQDKTTFTGGDTQFNAQVDSTGSAPAEFQFATSQDIADFNAELEIIGVGVIGDACNANQENLRFNSAGELLECVSAQWQYAGIETRKGTITYYSLDAANGYGEFHWAGDGINIPGYHHVCSTQSIESSNQAEGGGARIEVNSGQDSFGRHQWQYLAHAGVQDADAIPLVLQSGERTVICLSLGPEPVQATVSTTTNSAPTGSVSCSTGYVGEPFIARASVSDPDAPIIYQWSASGACSLAGAVENTASIRRNNSGTCAVRVTVTDYYNASRTISRSCRVRSVPPAEVQGVCGCTVNTCASGSYDSDPPEPPPPPGHDPLVDGPWDPDEKWKCKGRNGGASDSCTEGGSCGAVNGSCSGTPNNCVRGNAGGLSITRQTDQTIYRWTCSGIAGGSDDSCVRTRTHSHQCLSSSSAVNAVCGSADNAAQGCTSGDYEDAPGGVWACRGQCGGTDADCGGGPSVINGVCGAITDRCLAGSFQTVAGDTWNCQGINGGTDATGCVVSVNGNCGSSIGACAAGTSSDPGGASNPWTCAGENGGADLTCTFGVCSGAANSCDQGTYNNITGSPSWRCQGSLILSSADDVDCEIGVCGDTQGACDDGTSSGSTNPWACAGGASHSTADDVDCYVGACGTADDDVQGCTVGDWEHVDDTATDVLWDCKGAVDGSTTDDIQCTLGLPICGPTQGACDQGTPVGSGDEWICRGATTDINCTIGVCHFNTLGHAGGCDEGVSSDPSGNPWTCQGSYHDPAITTDDADCFIGACGSADNNIDGCPVGTWIGVPDFTSPTVVRWKCEGSDSGETNDDNPCTQEPGDCASTLGDCVQGITSDPRGATNPWVCAGTGGGSDETCVFSVCGTADNATDGCMPGAYQDVTGHTWACQGNSRDINCHVGLCDYSGPGQCVSPSTPYGTGYEWTCLGANNSESADDVDCVKAQCNTTDGADNSIKGCITGEWDPNAPDGFWHCRGNHPVDSFTGDDDLNCAPPPPEPGQCDYVYIGDCAEGTTLGTGNPWVCQGSDSNVDTDDADCFIGECGYYDNAAGGCLVGTYEHVPGDTWHCRGSDGVRSDDDFLHCRPPDPTPGECDYNNIGVCLEGDSSDPSGNTNPWMCKGNHPNPDETSDDVNCEIGICDTATDTCDAGTLESVAGPTWNCLGNHPIASITNDDALGCTVTNGCGVTCPTNDYSNTPIGVLYWETDGLSGSCRLSLGNAYPYGTNLGIWPPNQLSCNAAQCGASLNTCDSGQLLPTGIITINGVDKWVCITAGPANTGSIDLCTLPVNGVCGAAVGDCDEGNPADVDTGAGTWTCEGENGGTDASCGTQVTPPYSCIPLSAEMGTLSSGRPGAGDPWPPLCSAASYGNLTNYSSTDASEATAECAFNAAQGYTRDQSAGLSGGDIGIVDCVMGGFISPVQPVPRTLNGIPLLINAGYNSLAPTAWNDWYFSDINICESRPPSYFSSWTECASYYTP